MNQRTNRILFSSIFLSCFLLGSFLLFITPTSVKATYGLTTETRDGETISFNVFEPRNGAKKIEVDYEVLEPLVDMENALLSESPKIHSGGNLLSKTEILRGNIEEGRSNSAFVTSGTYNTQMIEYAYLEPESAIALYNNDVLTVYSQGQGIYEDRKQISKILGLEAENIRIILVPNGGGFGGKEDLSVQHYAALAAYHLKRPVKLTLTRDQSILIHPKRHPMRMRYELGCDKKGKLTFLEADILGDTGAYASVGMKVLERAAGHAAGVYSIPNLIQLV